jgi:hypothetical protein
VTGFPAETFRVDGDPSAIRGSARGWMDFADQAGRAAAQIRGLDTSLFIGPEGDQYRDGLSAKLPRHLEATSAAYGGVASALNVFAASLDDVQERMGPLTVRGPSLWADLDAAGRALETAKATDLVHRQRRALAQAQLLPDEVLPTDHYVAATGPATTALTAAQHAWNQALATAQTLKADLTAAINLCVAAINEQAHTRFTPNPSGFSAMVDNVKGFVKDHAAALSKISAVLKGISLVAGVLCFVPGLNLIAAPIALAAGAAALAIDATTMWATGKTDITELALDAVAIIPAGRILGAAGKLAGKAIEGTELAAKASQATARVSQALTNGGQLARAGIAGAKAGATSLSTDIQEARIAIAVTDTGLPVILRDGKTTGTMLTDAQTEAKTAFSEVRQMKESSSAIIDGDLPAVLKGSSNPLEMVPADAIARSLTPTSTIKDGIEYQWKNAEGQTVRLRVHGPDGTAPGGSNAAVGPVYRLQIGGRYLGRDGIMYPRGAFNENSPNYDPNAADDTHIPWPDGHELPWEN